MLIISTLKIFSLVWILVQPAVSRCNQMLCIEGCGAFDARFQSCNIDYQVYSSIEECVCAGIGTIAENEQSLINCLACKDGNLGSNPLEVYKIWAAICGTYQLNGEEAAIRLGDGSKQAAVAYYSKTVLPTVESTCAKPSSGVALHPELTVWSIWSMLLAILMHDLARL